MNLNRLFNPFTVALLLLLLFASLFYRIHLHCTSYFDLGIYSDALNRIQFTDLNPFLPGRNIRIFNDHFDPILIPVSVLTRFFPAPLVGISIEYLALVLCWIPIRRIRDAGKITPGIALFCYAFLLLNHATVDAIQTPFHPTTWAVLPLVWMFSSYLLQENRNLIISLFFLFCCREEFPLIGPPLALALWMTGKRRLAGLTFGFSTLWILFVFFLRPRIFDGHFENYGSAILHNFFTNPFDVIQKNMTLGALRMLLERCLPLFLLFQWGRRKELMSAWSGLVLISAPIFGIRFISNQWAFHYGTATIVCALFFFLPGLTLRVSGWRRNIAILFLLTTFFAQPIKVFTGNHPRCAVNPSRLQSIKLAQGMVAHSQKANVLLENNLASTQFLVSPKQQTIHLLCSPTGTQYTSFDVVLVEKPGSGDPWPCSYEQIGQMISAWKTTPSVRVLIDDEHVFLAEGVLPNESVIH